MASKSNRVKVQITYRKELLSRHSVDGEMNFVLALNALLEKHRVLSTHLDPIAPVVSYESSSDEEEGNVYTGVIRLVFNIRHEAGKLYQYPRLHYMLFDIATLVDQYADAFDYMKREVDLSGMPQPWALVAGPQTCLLRKNSAQWNATEEDIPGFFNTHTAVDGLTVMGEPRAVENFRRVWQFQVKQWESSFVPGEKLALEAQGVHYGPNLDMSIMKRNHPELQWQHLLIWAHAIQVPGNDGWFVTNLDETDPWLVAGIKYTNVFSESMLAEDLPFDAMPSNSSKKRGLKFFPELDSVSFNTESV